MNEPLAIIFPIAALFFLGAFVHVVWKMIDIHRRQAASVDWPVTTAAVTGKLIHSTMSNKGGRLHRPEITFTYSVMGQKFEKKISLGTTGSKSAAQAALNRVGQTVEVRYNPEKPEQQITALEIVRTIDKYQLLLYFLCFVLMLNTLRTHLIP